LSCLAETILRLSAFWGFALGLGRVFPYASTWMQFHDPNPGPDGWPLLPWLCLGGMLGMVLVLLAALKLARRVAGLLAAGLEAPGGAAEGDPWDTRRIGSSILGLVLLLCGTPGIRLPRPFCRSSPPAMRPCSRFRFSRRWWGWP